MGGTVHLVGMLAVLAIALDRPGTAEATPIKRAHGVSNTKGLSLETYSAGLLDAITEGAKVKEVDRYIPPDGARPKHRVHVLDQGDGKSFWYLTNGFGFIRQPGSTPGSEEVFVELAARADRKDIRIAEILSLLGEAMHGQATGGPFNAWNYDTIILSQEVCGLRYFVLRPGAELEMPREDQREQRPELKGCANAPGDLEKRRQLPGALCYSPFQRLIGLLKVDRHSRALADVREDQPESGHEVALAVLLAGFLAYKVAQERGFLRRRGRGLEHRHQDRLAARHQRGVDADAEAEAVEDRQDRQDRIAAALLLATFGAAAQSDTPAQFKPVTDSFDYVKRDLMIPMR